MLISVTDLDALRQNARQIKAKCGKKLIAVLKYDAYGGGMEACARALLGEADAFAVSTLPQAAALLKAEIPPGRIMVLDPILPAGLDSRLARVILPVDCPEILRGLADIYIDRPLRVQLRADVCGSGIGLRAGAFDAALEAVAQDSRFTLCGLFAHAPSLYRRARPQEVVARFSRLCEKVRAVQPDALCHLATSAALDNPALYFDAVRVGTALYGLPSGGENTPDGLLPVRALHAPVLRVIDNPGRLSFYDRCAGGAALTRVGIVGAGYGALPALLHARALCLLVRGQRAPVIGVPCMGHLVVDLSGIDGVRPGDTAVFVGRSGGLEQTAAGFAARCGIPGCRCDGALFATKEAACLVLDRHNCIVK